MILTPAFKRKIFELEDKHPFLHKTNQTITHSHPMQTEKSVLSGPQPTQSQLHMTVKPNLLKKVIINKKRIFIESI